MFLALADDAKVEISMPRQRKPPKRLDTSGTQQVLDLKAYFHRQYNEVLDTVSEQLSTRFDQIVLTHLMTVEKILLDGAEGNMETYNRERETLKLYDHFIDMESLKNQVSKSRSIAGQPLVTIYQD